MKRFESHNGLLIILAALVLLALPVTAAGNAKGDLLRRTMADIALLNGQMAQRKMDAAEIRDALLVRLDKIKTEVSRELQKKEIETEAEALSYPRLLYDLMLIAEIQAYIDRYKQKIGHYRLAYDRLSYLYQQADDDLKIINTLSDLKIDALIAQVDKILAGYLPDAQTLVIHPDNLTIEAPQKIWKALKDNR